MVSNRLMSLPPKLTFADRARPGLTQFTQKHFDPPLDSTQPDLTSTQQDELLADLVADSGYAESAEDGFGFVH